jgi:SOS-response transcriptional repressor LexA
MHNFYRPQHPLQIKLLALANEMNLGRMSLREVGSLIGVKSAEVVKHHLRRLEERNLITHDLEKKIITPIRKGSDKVSNFINVPILGAADCGPASRVAEAEPQGFLKLSKKILHSGKDIFAVRAHGHSMNRAKVKTIDRKEKTIEDGDYVLIDSKYVRAKNGDYVLSVIDGLANIKKYHEDRENEQIILLSESSRHFPPIYIHWDEAGDCVVNGKVIEVIKKPKL